jgi:hypothetical protein
MNRASDSPASHRGIRSLNFGTGTKGNSAANRGH